MPAGFEDGRPLWFGMLAESQALGGQQVGPTCARVIDEVIRTNVERDPNSMLNRPSTAFADTTTELLDFALANEGGARGPF
jgi:hypothetical protein